MELCEESDLDRKIREILKPDAEVVQCIVGHALAAKERRRSRLVPALAAIGICIVAWLIYVGLPRESPEILTLDFVGDIAVVQAPDGTSWVFSEDGREPGPSVETGLILYEGDPP
jgi:hypothetical protein